MINEIFPGDIVTLRWARNSEITAMGIVLYVSGDATECRVFWSDENRILRSNMFSLTKLNLS